MSWPGRQVPVLRHGRGPWRDRAGQAAIRLAKEHGQVIPEGGRAGQSLRRVGRQALAQDGQHPGRHAGNVVDRLAVQEVDGRRARLPPVGREARRPARHQGVDGGGERVQVGGRRRLRPLEAFRRRVRRGQRVPAHRLIAVGRDDRGQPEVRDTDNAVAVDQDVGRLEVPVQDARRVRRGERVGQVGADTAGPLRAHRPAAAQLIVERAARAQFHHHVRAAVPQRPGVVDVDDVRVTGQLPGRCYLAEETPLVALGVQHPAVHLDGRLAADRDLPGLVDGGEASRAEHTGHGVPGNVWCRDHNRTA